jgi:hypothetical protein
MRPALRDPTISLKNKEQNQGEKFGCKQNKFCTPIAKKQNKFCTPIAKNQNKFAVNCSAAWWDSNALGASLTHPKCCF